MDKKYYNASLWILKRRAIFAIKDFLKVLKAFMEKLIAYRGGKVDAKKVQHDFFNHISNSKGRHIIILGASPSAWEYKQRFQFLAEREDVLVIGCNWTNYLDVEIDFFVSAYPWVCRLAQKTGAKVKSILNPSLHGSYIGYGITNIKRENFGNDVGLMITNSLGPNNKILYSNQNVIFLMINLAYSLEPKSITFCGFEGRKGRDNWNHFYSGDSDLKNKIMSDIISLDDKDILTNSTFGSLDEILIGMYNNIFVPTFESVETKYSNFRSKKQVELSSKRDSLIDEFITLAEKNNVPLYRLGATSLFEELSEPSFLWNEVGKTV